MIANRRVNIWLSTDWHRAFPIQSAGGRGREASGKVDAKRGVFGVARKMKVLIVDDNAVNRRVLECALEALGVDTVSVEGGEEAVQAALGFEFSLILMDLMMPRVSGFEAARRIRDADGGARVPIVAVSAAPELRGTLDYEMAQFDGFLAKPVEMKKLGAHVLAALNGRLGGEPVERRLEAMRAF